jgi:hypothetical protein
MAENESLDLRLSRRWFRVLKAIRGCERQERTSALILQTLKKAWSRTQRQLTKHGTSLQQVIDATLDQADLDGLYRQTKRHDYVKLFQVEQQPFDTPERLMQRVVSGSLDRVLDQVRDKIIGSEVCPNVGAWKNLRESCVGPIRSDILRFVDRLAERPAVAVRVAAMPTVGERSSAGMVDLSLLDGHVLPAGVQP